MRMPLHARILLGAAIGAGLGIAVKTLWGEDETAGSERVRWVIATVTGPIGAIFLRLLLMLVIPLLFSALVLGVAELGDVRKLGRIGLKTLVYTVSVSLLAVLLGVFMVSTFRPGEAIDDQTRQRIMERSAEQPLAVRPPAAKPASGVGLIVNIVPDNPVRAAAEGDFLAWMFFALMVGIALCLLQTPATAALRDAIGGLYEVSFLLIRMVIWLAPLGVAALLFNLTAQFGYELLVPLAWYVGVVIAALAIHQFVTYSIVVSVLGGMSPARFFRGVQEAMITAFSTASSAATLPTALKVAEQNLRLPPQISRFVLTVGATANQNGTALFEGVTVLFLAQVYGIELSLGQQLTVVLIAVLGGIGTAGVPGGSLPVVMMIMGMVGIPAEGIGLILGVDRLLDMCRTTLNVTGDLAAVVVVSRGEAAELPVEEAGRAA